MAGLKSHDLTNPNEQRIRASGLTEASVDSDYARAKSVNSSTTVSWWRGYKDAFVVS